MRELTGRVAVVTGAASGIGRELALACAREGMRLVLADLDRAGLDATLALLPRAGGPTSPAAAPLAVTCDVSKPDSVERLAAASWDTFGDVHLLFNNAGVAVSGPVWAATIEDWQWSLGVNLMGVVHGIRSFVPRMLERGQEGHIVNTASVAGFISVPGSAVYCATKHAVVTLSECLLHDLALVKSRLAVSVLAPAFVNTGIADSARNRPAELAATNPLAAPFEERMRRAICAGRLSAADIAQLTIEGVKADRFYIISHPAILPSIEARAREILEGRIPVSPMP
ncbi:MAG TPA: SDR family NAD(P)-dependent oxidoreductase [Steroidobacteraceae bacterium]|nr:SDR family NAD(P)-dependent oxidoreductase [Steroidobacteraceae bacterium]HNS27138.1 SDR family NAD(P)-dependent oxidoreductase [Steroidobacteraceae bacterium]